MTETSTRGMVKLLSGESPFPWFVGWSGENPFPWGAPGHSGKLCGAASVESASAAYVFGHLFVLAKGEKPNPCYEVTIERSPLAIYPPQFVVRACVEPGKICSQLVTPYTAFNLFASGPLETITLKTAQGDRQIPVKRIEEPRVQGMRGGDHVPYPLTIPIRLSSVFEEKLEVLEAPKPREATGYSESFSFDEAFRDAVQNLPPAESAYPDKLVTVEVTSVGALFGGFIGLNKMYVKVRAS
jgi:hypothetical protein